jgi:RNA recognition motif-containing protein
MTHLKTKPQKLFIENLSSAVTIADLKKLFSRVGEVIQLRINLDPVLFRSLGSASIEMKDGGTAARCLEKLNGLLYFGKVLRVQRA